VGLEYLLLGSKKSHLLPPEGRPSLAGDRQGRAGAERGTLAGREINLESREKVFSPPFSSLSETRQRHACLTPTTTTTTTTTGVRFRRIAPVLSSLCARLSASEGIQASTHTHKLHVHNNNKSREREREDSSNPAAASEGESGAHEVFRRPRQRSPRDRFHASWEEEGEEEDATADARGGDDDDDDFPVAAGVNQSAAPPRPDLLLEKQRRRRPRGRKAKLMR